MADPSSLDDLESELRRMEEELASLKGKKPKKAKREAPPPEAPVEAAPSDAPADASAEAAPDKAARFGFKAPKVKLPFGRRGATEAAPADEPEGAAARPESSYAASARTDAPAIPAVPQPEFLPPSGRWSQDGTAWVLRLDAEPAVVRRVVDAEGEVVKEEPATRELLALAPEPGGASAAEEGPGPLHALAARLGERKGKKGRGWFSRKKD